MKSTVLRKIILVLLFGLSNLANAQDRQTEYFSYIVQCPSSKPKLLDFIEADMLRNQHVTPNISRAQSEEEILNELSHSFQKFSPMRNKELLERYSKLKSNIVFNTGIKFTPHTQPDNQINLEGCELTPVAASMLNIGGYPEKIDNHIIVDKSIWDQLEKYEQVAIILNFALTEEIQEENLIPNRIFIGYWFSNSFLNLTTDEWMKLNDHLHFPYIEYKNLKLDLKYGPYDINKNIRKAFLYKTSPFTVNHQVIYVKEVVEFYYPSGNIKAFQESTSFVYQLPTGEKINFFGLGDEEGSLGFFDNNLLEVNQATFKTSEKTMMLYGHELTFNNEYLKIRLYSPGLIQKIGVRSAKIKVRNTVYKIACFDEIKNKSSSAESEIIFYKDGSIYCADDFQPNQVFLDQNLKNYKNTYMERICFDTKGLKINPIH